MLQFLLYVQLEARGTGHTRWHYQEHKNKADENLSAQARLLCAVCVLSSAVPSIILLQCSCPQVTVLQCSALVAVQLQLQCSGCIALLQLPSSAVP